MQTFAFLCRELRHQFPEPMIKLSLARGHTHSDRVRDTKVALNQRDS